MTEPDRRELKRLVSKHRLDLIKQVEARENIAQRVAREYAFSQIQSNLIRVLQVTRVPGCRDRLEPAYVEVLIQVNTETRTLEARLDPLRVMSSVPAGSTPQHQHQALNDLVHAVAWRALEPLHEELVFELHRAGLGSDTFYQND